MAGATARCVPLAEHRAVTIAASDLGVRLLHDDEGCVGLRYQNIGESHADGTAADDKFLMCQGA